MASQMQREETKGKEKVKVRQTKSVEDLYAGEGSGCGSLSNNACLGLVAFSDKESPWKKAAAAATPAPVGSGSSQFKPAMADGFYDNLCKFYHPLGLVFNFRETSLDLYLFYNEVTRRGGYGQVTKNRGWGEIASVVKLKESASLVSPTLLQKLYESLLYQFEQTYYYRTPAYVALAPGAFLPCPTLGDNDNSSYQMHKRKQFDDPSPSSTLDPSIPDSPAGKKKSGKAPRTVEQGLSLQTTPAKKKSEKKLEKTLGAPPRFRTGYQIFLNKECERLKKTHGESSAGLNLRDMATEAWKKLSDDDKQPYLEASRREKVTYHHQMAAYVDNMDKEKSKALDQSTSTNSYVIDFSHPSQTDDDYYVALQVDHESFHAAPGESTMKVAVEMLENSAPNEAIHKIGSDEASGSLRLRT